MTPAEARSDALLVLMESKVIPRQQATPAMMALGIDRLDIAAALWRRDRPAVPVPPPLPRRPRIDPLRRVKPPGEGECSPAIRSIIAATASYFEIDQSDLLSRYQDFWVSHPRQVAMYLCRSTTSASFPEIARAFDRDHTTVMHACTAVAADPLRMAAALAIGQKVAA